MKKCPTCSQDLKNGYTVKREYVSKSGNDSVFAYGHYDNQGFFEKDSFDGFPKEDSFDLVDGSDTCTHCDCVLQ